MESESVIPAASPRDLELDFPTSLWAHRESRTSTTLACDSASKIVIASQIRAAQREGIIISNDQNMRKKRMFVKTTDDECETTSFPVNITLGRLNMTLVAQCSFFSHGAIVMMT